MTAQELGEKAVEDPKLGMDQIAIELGRVVLGQALSGDDKPSATQVAAVLEGIAKVREAGGGSNLREVLSEFFEK